MSILLLNEMKQQQCMMLLVLAISIVAVGFCVAWRGVESSFLMSRLFGLERRLDSIRFDSQEFFRNVTAGTIDSLRCHNLADPSDQKLRKWLNGNKLPRRRGAMCRQPQT